MLHQMSGLFDARWHVSKLRRVLLVLCTLLVSIAWDTKAQQNNIDLARSISASLKFDLPSDSPSEGAKSELSHPDDHVDADSTFSATAYLDLEDSLFFDKEKRNIESSKAPPHHTTAVANNNNTPPCVV